jgi:ribose/xylose/arabinose/galactoside ABC-type transport system permease subunit
MTVTTPQLLTPVPAPGSGRESLGARAVRAVLTQRVVLLAVLLVVLLAIFFALDVAGVLSGSFDGDYMAAALINAVPLALLGIAQLFVIVSGRGGIDLSIGAIVSLSSMIFGLGYGLWSWPLWTAILATVAFGAQCGAVNGILIARLGFPALIATLATYYAFSSLALVINDQTPISTEPIQALYGSAKSVELPVIGRELPDIPLGVFLYMIPVLLIAWLVISRTVFGRRLFAIGTNDTAAQWAGVNVRSTRSWAYVLSGALGGLVAVVTTAQFASAQPDAGTSGNGMALPAITIAVLGGVAITGGIGRVSGIALATLLVVWLNAGLLLTFPGSASGWFQLLALGVLLVFAALLNGITSRRFSGAR